MSNLYSWAPGALRNSSLASTVTFTVRKPCSSDVSQLSEANSNAAAASDCRQNLISTRTFEYFTLYISLAFYDHTVIDRQCCAASSDITQPFSDRLTDVLISKPISDTKSLISSMSSKMIGVSGEPVGEINKKY